MSINQIASVSASPLCWPFNRGNLPHVEGWKRAGNLLLNYVYNTHLCSRRYAVHCSQHNTCTSAHDALESCSRRSLRSQRHEVSSLNYIRSKIMQMIFKLTSRPSRDIQCEKQSGGSLTSTPVRPRDAYKTNVSLCVSRARAPFVRLECVCMRCLSIYMLRQ